MVGLTAAAVIVKNLYADRSSSSSTTRRLSVETGIENSV